MLEKLITADVSACTGLSVGHDSQLCPSQSTFAKKKTTNIPGLLIWKIQWVYKGTI